MHLLSTNSTVSVKLGHIVAKQFVNMLRLHWRNGLFGKKQHSFFVLNDGTLVVWTASDSQVVDQLTTLAAYSKVGNVELGHTFMLC